MKRTHFFLNVICRYNCFIRACWRLIFASRFEWHPIALCIAVIVYIINNYIVRDSFFSVSIFLVCFKSIFIVHLWLLQGIVLTNNSGRGTSPTLPFVFKILNSRGCSFWAERQTDLFRRPWLLGRTRQRFTRFRCPIPGMRWLR